MFGLAALPHRVRERAVRRPPLGRSRTVEDSRPDQRVAKREPPFVDRDQAGVLGALECLSPDPHQGECGGERLDVGLVRQ